LSTPLSPQEQRELLDWMLKGASPAAICAELGWSVERFWKTLDTDADFAEALQQLFDTLSWNVLTVLYQAAMKGQLSAQQFWLRQRPVSGWGQTPETDPGPDPYEQLNDDQLVDACRQAELDLAAEIAAHLATTPRGT